MRKHFFAAGLLLAATLGPWFGASAQTAGHFGIWQGQVGTRRILLTLGPDSSTLAVPERGAFVAGVASLRTPGDSLIAAAQFGKPVFRGQFTDQGRALRGTYTDYVRRVPVVLRRVVAVQPLRLAQAVARPLPYRSDSVVFRSPGDSLRFGGTLTYPTGQRRVPAVVLLSGTGPQTRNGAPGPGGHQPFEVLADYLTRRGFAVLRTDDRGVGQTTGRYDQATTADFARDALVAVRYLRQRPDIDPARVGLVGHSEGGAAVLIAAAESSDVAFGVSLAGLLAPGLQALLFQNTELVRAEAMPARDKARLDTINGRMFRTAYAYARSPELEARLRATYQQWKSEDDAQLAANHVLNDRFRYPLESYVRQATGPWYRYHIRYDPAVFLPRVHVPLLLLGGDRDLMVDYHSLYAAAAALRQGGNPAVTVRVMPGLNHLLQACRTCLPTEYGDLDETLSPSVLRAVGDWLKQYAR